MEGITKSRAPKAPSPHTMSGSAFQRSFSPVTPVIRDFDLKMRDFKKEYKGLWGKVRTKIQSIDRKNEHDGIATARVNFIILDPSVSFNASVSWKGLVSSGGGCVCSNLAKVTLNGIVTTPPPLLPLQFGNMSLGKDDNPPAPCVSPEKPSPQNPRRISPYPFGAKKETKTETPLVKLASLASTLTPTFPVKKRGRKKRIRTSTKKSVPFPETVSMGWLGFSLQNLPPLLNLPTVLIQHIAGFLPLPSYATLLRTSSLLKEIDHPSVHEVLAKSRFGERYLTKFYSKIKNKEITWKKKLQDQVAGHSKKAAVCPDSNVEDYGIVIKFTVDDPSTLDRKRHEGYDFKDSVFSKELEIQSEFNSRGEIPDEAAADIVVLPQHLIDGRITHDNPLLAKARLTYDEVIKLKDLKAKAVKEGCNGKHGSARKHLDAFLETLNKMFAGRLSLSDCDDTISPHNVRVSLVDYTSGKMLSLVSPDIEDGDCEGEFDVSYVYFDSLNLPVFGNAEIRFSFHSQYKIKDGDVVLQHSPSTEFQVWDMEYMGDPEELDGKQSGALLSQLFMTAGT